MKLFRPTEGIPAHRLSSSRLYGILLLFLILSGYAIWKSERFQNLIQGVSQARLSAALGVPVSFETVELRFFPPSVHLANVRIANDPALGLSADRPLLEAEEVTVGGGVSLVGQELRLGRIRAVSPHLRVVQAADGRFNLPPGLSSPSRGGLKVSIGSVLIQQGVLEFKGRKAAIDGRFDDLTAELIARTRDRYTGTLAARRATVTLPNSEPLVAGLSARFRLDTRRGLTLDELRLSGAFGRLSISGEVEKLSSPHILLTAAGQVEIEEMERLFRSPLGFRGAATFDGAIEIPPQGGFRVAGRLRSPRVGREQFVFEDVAATVTARPEALVAELEQIGYAGGKATGALRIANLTGKPQPMTLQIDGKGISLERFFADLGLKGTGLSGAASLQLGLRWGEDGLEKADGGGAIQIQPGPAASLVRGRFGLPTGGGGPIAVVRGRLGFEGVTLRFPQSTLGLTGGLRIGQWQPDFDVDLSSRDLSEVDRLLQNFVAATGGKPEALGLGGSGQIVGHVGGTWSEPDASVQVTAEEARYASVSFGSVRGTVDMRKGAFFFRPLHVYEGDASMSLEGMARYRFAPGQERFDLQIAARSYPLSRLLQYLDLKFPVDGRISGAFPLSGTPERLNGGGPVELADAVVWGEKIPLIKATLRLTPGVFGLGDVIAELGGGMIRASGSLTTASKTFQARAAGDGVSIESIAAAGGFSSDVAGKLSFQVSGEGALEHPDLKISANLSQARFFGHPVPAGLEPRAQVTVSRGVMAASIDVPHHWRLEASGDVFGASPKVDLALDASDLASLLQFTPITLSPGLGGTVAAEGHFNLPAHSGDLPSGSVKITRARLDLPDRPGVIAAAGTIDATLDHGKLTIHEFSAVGEGSTLKLGGSFDVGQGTGAVALAAQGTVEGSALALLSPDIALQGRLSVDVRASGTLQKPSFSGSVRLENGRYRLVSLGQIVDDVDASVTFHESRGDLEARAKFGGGDFYAGGSFSFTGLSLTDFRVSVQGRRVRLPQFQDFRLIADLDLVATGSPSGNAIRGSVSLVKGTYSKDFEITLSDLLARGRPAGVAVVEPWKERTTLEVRVVSADSLEIRNNIARLTGTVDLIVRGTVAEPTLLGQIVLDEGGRVTFRDVRYDIESGTVTFANTRGFAPILDLHARADVKGYDLVVSLVGTWPRIQTSFSSDPPLPDETILALLLTGTTPSAGSQTETTASSIVSVGAGLAAGAVTGGLTRPTQKVLRLERFEIDPVFTGGQLTDVRSTIGKQITPDILFLYSQSFETSKLPIVSVEWRISNTIVLRAERDQNGIYLVDVRRRQRF
jgi:translocation-and-assembly-module (TAM) inner membrane subunit TamB-like protein